MLPCAKGYAYDAYFPRSCCGNGQPVNRYVLLSPCWCPQRLLRVISFLRMDIIFTPQAQLECNSHISKSANTMPAGTWLMMDYGAHRRLCRHLPGILKFQMNLEKPPCETTW